MKRKYLTLTLILIMITILALCSFSACASAPKDDEGMPPNANLPNGSPSQDDSFYPFLPDDSKPETGARENPIIDTATKNDIYFSIDSHTASYNQLKNIILSGSYYGSLAKYVQIDQMLNYFDYEYSTPQDNELLALNASMFDCPYNSQKKLLRIGLTAKEVEIQNTHNNVVLLLDVSGSMSGATKIDLMKEAMIKMVENLNRDDKISIVTYCHYTEVVIDGMSIGENSEEIISKIQSLQAFGATDGENGIQTAYEVAQKHYIEDGNNRVILATDGDFNIGIKDPDKLKEFISTKRDNGIYLTCIGLGNNADYSAATMEALAKSGNGYWGYIHDMDDAKKLLVYDLASTIITIAKDVKAKIVFNADTVKNYRLLGYENNLITSDDYEDKTTDAGEIGTGFTLSLCFEIQLGDGVDLSQDLEIANVNIRYKDATSTPNDDSSELDLPIKSNCYTTAPSQDDRFVSSVVEFALILLDSRYKANANLDNVIERLQSMKFDDRYKTQFVEVVAAYKENLTDNNLL